MYRLIAVLLCLLSFEGTSEAMEFRIQYQSELDLNVVVGDGDIMPGDEARLREVARRADRDDNGYVTLVLNSLGGSVGAAFDLVETLDDLGVYVIVPDNALCASACASIVYVSAQHHMLLGTGRLGFHSCYTDVAGETKKSDLCNELIAQNAMRRGVSYPSIMLFVDDYGPREMAWIDQAAACYIGLCRPPPKPQRKNVNRSGDSSLSIATTLFFGVPSFDCSKAKSTSEVAICADAGLAKLDQELGHAYAARLSSLGPEVEALRIEQRKWIKTRNDACGGDVNCLSRVITERIAVLKGESQRPPSVAPSFNCAKATSESELAICADAGLASLDRDLDRTYSARLGSTTTGKEALVLSQRQWIRERDKSCKSDVHCLSEAITARIALLK